MTDYSDNDWDELSADVQAAAKLLGWTDKLWQSDVEPPECDFEWEALTKEQQEAAVKLGYTQESWSEDD